MAIFSTAYLQDLMDNAEIELSQQVRCIFNRFSLATTAGQATYTLPSDVIGILNITYNGKYVYPQDIADWQQSNWFKPQNLGVPGTPKWWIRNGLGWNQIMFYPIPQDSYAVQTADLTLQSSLDNCVIISCYRAADPTNDSQRLVYYIRRLVCRYRAMARAYAKDSPQQNLQAAAYFQKKYDYYSDLYGKFIEKIPEAVQQGFGQPSSGRGSTPPRPVLPTSGKWSL